MRGFGWAALTIAGLAVGGATAGTTTFTGGIEGWGVFFDNDGTLGDFLETEDGNPDENLRWTMFDTFGCRFYNETNPDTLGDYSRFTDGVRLAVDVRTDDISYFGRQLTRNLIVELVDRIGDPNDFIQPVSVWYNLGPIRVGEPNDPNTWFDPPTWESFEVVIDDVTSATLPAGWGGTGAEDPMTFEPVLPPGRTFADVLQNVDEIRFTTYEPGYFYAFTNFQLAFDNPTVAAVEAPCVGDLNDDNMVDLSDLAGLLSAFGSSTGDPNFNPLADVDDDGVIGLGDLAGLLANFGLPC